MLGRNGKQEDFKAAPNVFYSLLPVATVWAPCGAHGTVKKLP